MRLAIAAAIFALIAACASSRAREAREGRREIADEFKELRFLLSKLMSSESERARSISVGADWTIEARRIYKEIEPYRKAGTLRTAYFDGTSFRTFNWIQAEKRLELVSNGLARSDILVRKENKVGETMLMLNNWVFYVSARNKKIEFYGFVVN